MPVTHSKVSDKVDASDESLVRPSDWNAEHTITDLEVDSEDINFTSTEVITATTLTTNHYLVKVNASGGNITITLPPISAHPDREYTIIKTDGSGNTVRVVGKINGEENLGITLQYQFITIHADNDGDEWLIIGGLSVKLEELVRDGNETQGKILKILRLFKKALKKMSNLDLKEE